MTEPSRRTAPESPSSRPSGAGVVVVGSLNRDYVLRVDRLPAPGETLLGGELAVGSGGKGGNQAVAAARSGGATVMVGCVGDDDDGHALLDDLFEAGVETSSVTVLAGARTGAAVVLVTAGGENAIVVAPGTNSRLEPRAAADVVRRRLRPPGVLVTQAEIPEATMQGVVEAAAELGCRPVLNLAPYREVPEALLALCDPLVVNEAEAGQLLGRDVHGATEAAAAAGVLAERTRSVVVTAGAEGAVVATGTLVEHVPAPTVDVVDTTGAGDAFTGVLATALSRGQDLLTAVRFGVRAAAWSVGRPGAQASYPSTIQLGVDPAQPTPYGAV